MNKTIDAIIVDDERFARKELRRLLQDYTHINILGEADDVSTASKLIKNKNPDVVFLDIQMPKETGFDLLELVNNTFQTIFVTAFDEYAIRAFEVNALDYLLKPISSERLGKAIEKLGIPSPKALPKAVDYSDDIFSEIGKISKMIPVKNIAIIRSMDDYTDVFLTTDTHFLSKNTLLKWEKILPKNHFFRIHRSTIINLNYVLKTETNTSDGLSISLKGMPPLSVSRRRERDLINALKLRRNSG